MPGFPTPNSDGEPEGIFSDLNEVWSAAARAAAAAGRKRKGLGTSARRDAARSAYVKSGGRSNVDKDIARRASMMMRQYDAEAPIDSRSERRDMTRHFYKRIKRQVKKGRPRSHYRRSWDDEI